ICLNGELWCGGVGIACVIGNSARCNIHCEADPVAPDVILSSPSAGFVNGLFTMTATFSESVTGLDASDISVSNGTVSNLSGSGDTYTFDITPTDEGLITVDLAAGVAQDEAGNTNTAAAQFSIDADFTAPDAPTVTSSLSQNTIPPVFSGSAEDGSTVLLGFDLDNDGTPDVVYATTASGGNWSIDLDSATPTTGTAPSFSEGDYTVIVETVDPAGNPSDPVTSTLTVDSTPPANPAINSSPSVNDPVLEGNAEEGSTITVVVDVDGDGTVDATYETTATDGMWSIDLENDTPISGTAPTIADGDTYSIGVYETDTAGNTSNTVKSTLTIDQTPPSTPTSQPTLETNIGNGDRNVTDDTTPTISGVGEAGNTVEVFANGESLGMVTVDDNGMWSFTPDRDLADGTYTFTYTLTDEAGNTSTPSTGFTFDIESVLQFAEVPPAKAQKKFKERINGTRGIDVLSGSNQRDRMIGRGGDDRLRGLGGDDLIRGGAGNDRVSGGKGNDKLSGQGGNDRLYGEKGDDRLNGGNGKDTMRGGAGNDVFIGKAGDDLLVGNKGDDMFVFNKPTDGTDTIRGFKVGEDVINISRIFKRNAYAADSLTQQFQQFIRIEQVGANTQVNIDADGSGSGSDFTTLAILTRVSADTIDSTSFVVS
ncbi:MAG: Ig-like domain-containing protein, partial [Cyanobacteria bacterium J06626_14]